MLDKVDLKLSVDKNDYNKEFDEHAAKIGNLQRLAKEAGLPIIILLEGWRGALRGTLINNLLSVMDPRGFRVYSASKFDETQGKKPFFTTFWEELPPNGGVSVYHRSWYFLKIEHEVGNKNEKWVDISYKHINAFEKQLTDAGYLVIKLFTHISKKQQQTNLSKMDKIYGKNWQEIKPGALEGEDHDKYMAHYEKMFLETNSVNAPWHIISAEDVRYAQISIFKVLEAMIEAALVQKSTAIREEPSVFDPTIPDLLASYDLSLEVDKKEYGNKLKEYHKKLQTLQFELYKKGIGTVIAFEGWDAGGKGGAIRRLTEPLDPLGYSVHPVAAPSDEEKMHHYLWRFWRKLPQNGEIAIFDRTWYGRVLVERVEGFAKHGEWRRAYQEINSMEEQWAEHGLVVVKFWLQIDKDEQYRRFKAREVDPDKQWKITDEDWRNREKWDSYHDAVNEMLFRTDTKNAPWIVVEANNKYYARLKVLKTVIDLLEEKLKG